MKRISVVLLTVGALLATAAVASASTAYFSGAIGGRHVRPRPVSLTVDGTLEVINVKWKQWGGRTAIGKGTAASHGCDPTCAQGKERRQPVTVNLYDRERCAGRVYYNRVTLRDRRGRRVFVSSLGDEKWAPCKE